MHLAAQAHERRGADVLEPTPESEVPRLGAHGEHVGPVHDAAALDAGEPEDETEQRSVRIERADGDAADAL